MSFQGISHKLFCLSGFGFVMFVVLVTGLRHGSLLHCSKPLHSLHSISPASLGFIALRSFQSLLTMPAAHFSARLLCRSGCGHWALIFADTQPTLKINTPIALVLSIVWLSIMQRFFCICHTGNRGCPRFRRFLLKLPGCPPSLHSQVARRTTDCKPFHSVSLHSLFATVPHRQPQALLPIQLKVTF